MCRIRTGTSLAQQSGEIPLGQRVSYKDACYRDRRTDETKGEEEREIFYEGEREEGGVGGNIYFAPLPPPRLTW